MTMKMTCSSKKHQKQKGFTVTEVAVVAAIIGVLTIGSISIYSEQKKNVQWSEAESRLAVVKASLLNFVRMNKFMPCPDQDGDGLEDRKANGVACKVSTGLLPYKDLQLSLAEVSDSWGHDFTYVVNRDTTDTNVLQPNTLADECPENSACFFNNFQPPAFNLETMPMMGESVTSNMAGTSLSADYNNFRICNVDDCGVSAGADEIDGEALVAVIVAHNKNGNDKTELDIAEDHNLGEGNYFVQRAYSESPHFDDYLVTVSGNELKDYYSNQLVELQNEKEPPYIPPTNPDDVSDRQVSGGSGNNGRFSRNIGVNVFEVLATDTNGDGIKDAGDERISFGENHANAMVTVTFKTKVEGGWEDANANKEGRFAEYSGGNIETKDTFVVGFNNEEMGVDTDGDGSVDRDDITNIEYLNEIGRNMSVGADDRVVDRTIGLDIFGVDESEQTNQYSYYDENDDNDNTWYEYRSYNVELNEDGELEMFFANFSTATSEKVTVQDLDVRLYNSPTSVPQRPKVKNIGDNSKTIDDIVRDGEI